MDRKTVIIIEDEEGLSKILSCLFQKAGYYTMVAGDGGDGLRCIEETHPDLVILDLNLPTMSGEEICRELKDNYDKSLAGIPIIVVTAKDSDEDRIAAKAMGADAYLTKPFSLKNLMNEVLKFA